MTTFYFGAYWCSPDFQSMVWLTEADSAGLSKAELEVLGAEEAAKLGLSAAGRICIGQRLYNPMTAEEAWSSMAADSKGSTGEAWHAERG